MKIIKKIKKFFMTEEKREIDMLEVAVDNGDRYEKIVLDCNEEVVIKGPKCENCNLEECGQTAMMQLNLVAKDKNGDILIEGNDKKVEYGTGVKFNEEFLNTRKDIFEFNEESGTKYNAIIKIKKPGSYYFNWFVATQTVSKNSSIGFAIYGRNLSQVGNPYEYIGATSAAKTGQVSGSSAVNYPHL